MSQRAMRFTALFTRDSPSVPAIQKAAPDLVSRADPDAFSACLRCTLVVRHEIKGVKAVR